MKKYTESHPIIFAIQGILALLFGWFIIFTNITELPSIVLIIGCALLALGVIETINAVYRKRHQDGWALSLAIAVIEIAVGVSLLLTRDMNIAIPFTIIAGYTIVRGLFEILIGGRSLGDPVDKFLWVVTGMFGVILGFAVLNSGDVDPANTTFVKIFGTYMMLFGLANLIFSIHSRSAKHLKAKTKKKK